MLLCYDFLEKEDGNTDDLHDYSLLQPFASNLQNMLMLAAVLPLLQELQYAALFMQRRDVYLQDLFHMIKRMRERIHYMYCSDNSFSGAEFDKWSNLRVRSANALKSQRVLELHPDDGVHFRIQDAEGEVVLLAHMVAVPPPLGTRGRPSRTAVPIMSVKELKKLRKYVKSLAQCAAESVINGIDERFDASPVPQALRIAHPFFYTRGGTPEQFLAELEVILQHFGTERQSSDGVIPPLVDAVAVRESASVAFDTLQATAKRLFSKEQGAKGMREVELAVAAAVEDDECFDDDEEGGIVVEDDGAGVSKSCSLSANYMRVLLGSPTAGDRLRSFMPLLSIYMVIVGSSVEDERLFSAMNFVKSVVRNRLSDNLEACIRVKVQTQFTRYNFPYMEALELWLQKPRRERVNEFLRTKD
jgi:hypothetical protein